MSLLFLWVFFIMRRIVPACVLWAWRIMCICIRARREGRRRSWGEEAEGGVGTWTSLPAPFESPRLMAIVLIAIFGTRF